MDDNVSPEVGFLRREAFRRTSAFFRFSPRPTSIQTIRKLHYDAKLDRITNTAGRLESRRVQATARTEFQQDTLEFQYFHNVEHLDVPFDITANHTVAPGAYRFSEMQVAYSLGPQRRLSGTVEVVRGAFYGGTRTGLNLSRGRLEVTPSLAVEPVVSMNRIELPGKDVTTALLASRVTYAMSPRAAVSGLVQYNSTTHSLSSSVRLRWEYEPGSGFYVVYTDKRDTLGPGRPELQNRGLIVKLTRLVRF